MNVSAKRQKFVRAFEGYKALPKEDQAKKSFSFTREEMKKIAFGNAAVQVHELATFRARIPNGFATESK